MFTISIDDRAVQAKLDAMPAKVRGRLEQAVYTLAEKLRSHIIQDKLLGQVLNRRSGRLGQSIQQKVESSGTSITGKVYSAGDVKYAAIHEFGGHIPAREIVAKNAQALAFTMGGKQVFAKKVNWPGATMPERSFMRLISRRHERRNRAENDPRGAGRREGMTVTREQAACALFNLLKSSYTYPTTSRRFRTFDDIAQVQKPALHGGA